jgi:hypothetical protein
MIAFARSSWTYLAVAGAGLLAGASTAVDEGKVDVSALGSRTALVIATGGDDESCFDHMAKSGSGLVSLGRDADADWCRHEVVVQAQDQGMVLDTLPVFTSGVYKPALSPRVSVTLNLRVPQGVAWLKDLAQKQVDLADTLLNHNRAGITLALVGSAPQEYSSIEAPTVGTSCAAVDALIRSKPESQLYQPASINIYYVENITGGGSRAPEGYDCFEWGAPNVIYVWWYAMDNILAHELGHALGLQYRNGHVSVLDGFTDANLMIAEQARSEAILQDHWTAGQVYRMNADTRSVLNLPAGVGDAARAFRTGIKRVCQDDPKALSPCPPLAFEE